MRTPVGALCIGQFLQVLVEIDASVGADIEISYVGTILSNHVFKKHTATKGNWSLALGHRPLISSGTSLKWLL